jgi:hypothetical protein
LEFFLYGKANFVSHIFTSNVQKFAVTETKCAIPQNGSVHFDSFSVEKLQIKNCYTVGVEEKLQQYLKWKKNKFNKWLVTINKDELVQIRRDFLQAGRQAETSIREENEDEVSGKYQKMHTVSLGRIHCARQRRGHFR